MVRSLRDAEFSVLKVLVNPQEVSQAGVSSVAGLLNVFWGLGSELRDNLGTG